MCSLAKVFLLFPEGGWIILIGKGRGRIEGGSPGINSKNVGVSLVFFRSFFSLKRILPIARVHIGTTYTHENCGIFSFRRTKLSLPFPGPNHISFCFS